MQSSDSEPQEGRLTRRQLLKSAAVGGGALLAAPYVGSAHAAQSGAQALPGGMNVILFLTDQDRAIRHFPAGWANTHLPGLTRLRRNGLTFNRAFTNSCMCSPARSTLMSGYFPAQHGVKYTLETDMPAGQYPQVELPLGLKNMASVASAAGYPKNYVSAGYDDSWLKGDIDLPATVNEDLLTKPSVQLLFLKLFNLSGRLTTPQMQRNYLNFYANLMRASDQYLVDVLDTLGQTGLLDNTLVVRTADHGEMGLAHGGLRQKNFNFYEESIGVPLVYSNPKLFKQPRRSNALVSHVDLLPTLASLLGAPRSARAAWQGVDYSKTVLSPSAGGSVQDYVVFTYDDFQAGQAKGPYIPPPNHITAIRETRWKLAKYYDVNGKVPTQWEMYDLKSDPLEKTNLAHRSHVRTPEQARQFKRLQGRLARVEATRLKPLR